MSSFCLHKGREDLGKRLGEKCDREIKLMSAQRGGRKQSWCAPLDLLMLPKAQQTVQSKNGSGLAEASVHPSQKQDGWWGWSFLVLICLRQVLWCSG